MSSLRFSVVINTDNRAQSLALTLEALAHLDHRCFEVIVVRGPTPDATDEVLAPHAGRIKVARCPERNLSMSRNIGIAMAAGDVVAFIDDDAYPDPAWLNRLEEAYDDPETVGVGGPVWDWSGARLQVLHSWANRLGDVWVDVDYGPDQSDLFSRPGTTTFCYPIGTNASFRRDRLVEIGGFDEQFEYGWDEVDLCHRFIEAGWVVRVIEDGYVYHKSLPSAIRGENRATKNMAVLLKNKAYYTFKHGWGVVPLAEIADSLAAYAQHYRDEITENVAHGLLEQADLDQYESDVKSGFDLGHAKWAEGSDRRRPKRWFAERSSAFLPFPTLRARAEKLHLCFLSVEYPPGPVHGIGRVVHGLATGLGRLGHEVHVLSVGHDIDRIDFEEGVWVHRMVPKAHPLPEGLVVTPGLWNYAATLRDEALRIHRYRALDLVQAPNWGTEGIAIMADGRLPLVVGLYTPLATVAEVDTPLAEGRAKGDPEVPILIELERLTYRRAPHFLACGRAIVEEIEAAYGVELDDDRVGYVPHGITDRSGSLRPNHWEGRVEVLFVGRLEDRKGIDTLLSAIPAVVRSHPEVGFTIVGEDSRPMTDGLTHRERFERSALWAEVADHVRFLGRIGDDELYPLYAGCDLLVVPSRYESFGLILLEAMQFAKPVVAAKAGGMTEIVEDHETGLLVPPGDPEALARAVGDLVGDAELRHRLGRAGRERFKQRYRSEAMVEGANRFYDRIVGRSSATQRATPAEPDDVPEPAPLAHLVPSAPRAEEARPARSRADQGLHGLHGDLLMRIRCPHCGSPVAITPLATTSGGHVKTGRIDCVSEARFVGRIDHFKIDFFPDEPPEAAEPIEIPELGEQRVAADSPRVRREGAWVPNTPGALSSPGVVGDALVLEAECTDVVVRLRREPTGGIADVFVDGMPVATVDLYQPEGSENIAVRALSDLPFARREVTIRARGTAHADALDRFIVVEGFVLYGPLDAGFDPPAAVNCGNPYSPYLDRWLETVPIGEPVLEFGGGDRRRCRAGQINLEYLKFELADGYADIHAIPFADDTFAATWSQAVFEHVDDPFKAAAELVRVTRPGGLVLTEVAFMQPLHAVPYHFFNMTTWGVTELFAGCEVLECDWFGELSTTVEWLTNAAGLATKVDPTELAEVLAKVRSYDRLVSHEDLKSVASAVYLVVRKAN